MQPLKDSRPLSVSRLLLEESTRIERFEAITDSPPKACSSAFPAFRPKRRFALLAWLISMAKAISRGWSTRLSTAHC